MSKETFADRLKLAMDQQKVKQVDLLRMAEERGIKLGKSHVSQYVSGKTVPRAGLLRFLAEALQVEEGWLRGEETAKSEAEPGGTSFAGVQAQTEEEDRVRGGGQKSLRNENIGNKNIGNNVKNKNIGNKALGGRGMREFRKSSKLDNVLYDVRGPVVEEAARMEEAGMQILKLNIGNPAPFGFRTPDEVIQDMGRQLTECEGYSQANGLFSARKAIMQYAQIKKIPNVSMDDIYTGNGVSELINLCMSALLDDGDEILIPSPDYPLWTASATLAGGTPVHYICDEQAEWYPDMEDIKKKITDRTKAIVIINPNNPTGALYPREVLRQYI